MPHDCPAPGFESGYRPRCPEQTLLYRVVVDHLKTFLDRAQVEGRGLPRFVERELRAFLRRIGRLRRASDALKKRYSHLWCFKVTFPGGDGSMEPFSVCLSLRGDLMSARNALLNAPPYAVEQLVRTLGQNLRTARLRRNLSIADMAEKIGVHRRVVGDAERGKVSTSIAVYVALLWALGLSEQLAEVASPERDEEGTILSLAHDRKRAGSSRGPDNDF